MTPEQRASMGDRAREVLENEAYIEAFASIEKELIESWKNSPARDPEGREKLWLMLAMLNKVQKALQSTMDSGKLARKDLEHRSLLERARSLTGI